nr:hypothetical protein [Prevotella sp.]
MNFVEFVEKYQQDMTPEQMLSIAKAIGKYLSCKLSDAEVHHLCAMVHGVLSEEHFDKYFADDAISKMWYEDADGTKHKAPFFTKEEVKEIFDKHKDDISDYTIHDLAVTMNLLRSDHHVLLERYSEDAEELKEMVVLMAIEYLQDPDSLYPTSKIWHNING